MIKMPKEVNKIMKTLEGAGFEAFAAGNCVRESLLGDNPFGWDIATSADSEKLKELLPEAELVNEKYGIIRLEYIDELYDNDGNFLGEEGVIIDVAPYRNGTTMEAQLSGSDFTMNAVADSPYKVIDPYNGREDIRKKLIRTVGDAEVQFAAHPVQMIRALRYAAQYGFDLHKSVYDAICKQYSLLDTMNMKQLRDEFILLMGAPHAGKGLSMVMDTGILKVILGEDAVAHLSKREMSDLTTLCQNVDKTHQVAERRLGLFYTAVDKKRAMPSIEKMQFDEELTQHLHDAVKDMAKLYFIAQKPDLKKFIYKKGWERYNYMASLEKAQRIVFDYFNETKIKSKMYLLDEIKMYKEPIFEEELAIDGNDLLEAGICKTTEEAAKMLTMLIEEMHVHPKKNTRKDLLALAKKYKTFKFLAWTRGTHWVR